jgi:hypothetical protein
MRITTKLQGEKEKSKKFTFQLETVFGTQ